MGDRNVPPPTATTYSLVHAASFEGQTVGNGRAGPVFRRLTEAWMRLAGVDFVAQAHEYARQLPEWEEAEIRTVRGIEPVHA